jgi:hypothetical protein
MLPGRNSPQTWAKGGGNSVTKQDVASRTILLTSSREPQITLRSDGGPACVSAQLVLIGRASFVITPVVVLRPSLPVTPGFRIRSSKPDASAQ